MLQAKHIRRFDRSRATALNLIKAVNYLSCLEIIIPDEHSPFYIDTRWIPCVGVVLSIDNSNANNPKVEFKHLLSQQRIQLDIKRIKCFTIFFNTPAKDLKDF